jgi:hypothetical protein
MPVLYLLMVDGRVPSLSLVLVPFSHQPIFGSCYEDDILPFLLITGRIKCWTLYELVLCTWHKDNKLVLRSQVRSYQRVLDFFKGKSTFETTSRWSSLSFQDLVILFRPNATELSAVGPLQSIRCLNANAGCRCPFCRAGRTFLNLQYCVLKPPIKISRVVILLFFVVLQLCALLTSCSSK